MGFVATGIASHRHSSVAACALGFFPRILSNAAMKTHVVLQVVPVPSVFPDDPANTADLATGSAVFAGSAVPAVQLAAVVDGMAVATSQAIVEGSRQVGAAMASQSGTTASDRPAADGARPRTTSEASERATTVPAPSSRVSISPPGAPDPSTSRAIGKSGARGGRGTRSSAGQDDFGADDVLIDALVGRLVMDLRAAQLLQNEAPVWPVAAVATVALVMQRNNDPALVDQAVATQDQASAEQVFAGALAGTLTVPAKGRPGVVAMTAQATPEGTHDITGIGVGSGHGGAGGESPQEEGASTGLLAELADLTERDGADCWPEPVGLYQPPLMNRRLETNGVDDALILLLGAMTALRARTLPVHEVPAPMPTRLRTLPPDPEEPQTAPAEPALPGLTRRRDTRPAERTWHQRARCARWHRHVGTAASLSTRACARPVHQYLRLSDLGPRPRVECAVFWVPAERPTPERLQREVSVCPRGRTSMRCRRNTATRAFQEG